MEHIVEQVAYRGDAKEQQRITFLSNIDAGYKLVQL
jgi:hypothetical protein